MNITTKQLDDVSLRLTVEVGESDYKDKVVDELKKIGRTHTIPGFRKGHISVQELQRRFGRQVTSDVINNEVYDAVIKYITDNKLNVLGQPLPVEVKELDLKNQKDFTFEYDLGLAPDLNLELDKQVTLPYYNIKVTDEMVNEQDANLRKRFGSQQPGDEFESDALVKGSLVELTEDGSVKEADDAIRVENGIVAPMYFVDKEEAGKFAGAKVGSKVVFNPRNAAGDNVTELASMLNIDKNRAAAVSNNFEMTVSEIIVVKPAELGEELYTSAFGKDKVKSEDEYREAVKQMIAGELAQSSNTLLRLEIKDFYMKKYGDMKLPETVLKKWMLSRDTKLSEETLNEEFPAIAEDLKWQIIREQAARQLEVKIDDTDLKNFAKAIAAQQFAQYGMANIADEILEKYAQNLLDDAKSRERIIEQVGDQKLYSGIANAVTLENKEVSLDEFKELASKY